nr:MAG TPA: hypothetical protein [Caudoviricetes sp.]
MYLNIDDANSNVQFFINNHDLNKTHCVMENNK